MLPIPSSAIGIAAGVGGLLFVGYCIYFDRKRHADPNFKKKLREKRKQKRQAKYLGSKIPDLRTEDAVQKFFVQQVTRGEELLGQGEVDSGLEHIGNAISVCAYRSQILQLFQSSLPPQLFHVLLQRLPMMEQNIKAAQFALYGNTDSFNTAVLPGLPPPNVMAQMQMAAFGGAPLGGPGTGPPVIMPLDEEDLE